MNNLIAHQPTEPTNQLPLPVSAADLLKAFLAGRNARTIRAYSQDLADFRNFINIDNLNDAARHLLSRGHGQANALAMSYKSNLVERGLQSATINRRLASLRSLVRLARTLGLVPWTLAVQNVKSETYRDTRGPGRQGLQAILNELDSRKTVKNIRDRCAVRLLYDLALRCSEVLSLDIGDVQIDQGTLEVLGKGKSSKQILSMPEPTLSALRAWIDVRGQEPGPLFINYDRAKKGHRLSSVSLYRIVRKLGERVGLRVRPHGLRHTAITEACKAAQANGIGLEEVLDFSRHSRKSIAILMIYRDRERNVQGQLASIVAAGAQ